VEDIKFEVEPVFEYVAKQFETYAESLSSELQIPNCYLETTFFASDHEELNGLVFFKDNALAKGTPSHKFDRRRYFYNFNYYNSGTPEEIKFNTMSGSYRFEDIILTNYSTVGSSNVSKNEFYNAGYEIGNVFPNKIYLRLSNLGKSIGTTQNFKKFLNNNNYKYLFISDIINGASKMEKTDVSIDGTTKEIDYYDLETFENLELDEETWFDEHTALIKDNEPDEDKGNYTTKVYDKFDEYTEEIVFVRIQKSDGQDFIQNFWIYPDAEGSVKFCDTQVKIEKEYNYQVFLYVLMNEDGEPSLHVIPHGDPTFAKIMQPPHPRPQVQFKNIKNEKNKIRIMMNLSSNEYKSKNYSVISETEEERFSDNYSLYDPNSLRDSFYQYETETGKFQIFKMDRQPISYYDIGTNATSSIAESERSTLMFLTDSIKPFKKYYYMIRSYNGYGYYSNPSPIYKVEMTKDANDTFLHVETVGFFQSDQNSYMLEKTMAKLLQVVPSSYQTILSEEEGFGGYSGINNEGELPNLGIVDKTIWDSNTKFKLRLVSRKTGKKIDINLNFKLTKNIGD